MYSFAPKKSLIARLWKTLLKLKWLLVVLSLALFQFGSAGYIYAKAEVAQWLIADAWIESLQQHSSVKPWRWADTYPVAKISIRESELFVLSGATGRILAFGPGHIAKTALPGLPGNTAIAGHRDTHFALLEAIVIGESISMQTPSGTLNYKVVETRIVHQDQVELLEQTEKNMLTLITCYPFNSISPNTELRYIVRAVQNSLDNQQLARQHMQAPRYHF
jgi:sortase A